MLRKEDFDFAIDETLKKHPDFFYILSSVLRDQVINKIELEKFTRNNGARARIADITKEDIISFFLEETIKTFNAASYFFYHNKKINSLPNEQEKIEYFYQIFPCYDEISNIIELIKNKDINSIIYYQTNQNELFSLINNIINIRYIPDSPYRNYIDAYGEGPSVLENGKIKDLFHKIQKDYKKSSNIQNIQVRHKNINKCVNDLINGAQLTNKRSEYTLGSSLFATQDVGNKREQQEDTTLILVHPKNKKYKFLAVSDGMGGVQYGEKASTYLLEELNKWFINIPENDFDNPVLLQKKFNQKIKSISEEIYCLYNEDYKTIKAGATFVGAIVTSKETIISSVGDSRAYASSKDGFRLLTSDESLVWPMGQSARNLGEEVIDDLRFKRYNNQILRFIGLPINSSIQSFIIKNNFYDKLILLTDGVTDLLSTDRIRFLSQNAPPELLTKYLVDEAITYDAIRKQGADNLNYDCIPAGKDNATAAAYIRRK